MEAELRQRPLSPRTVHFSQAYDALSAIDHLRCARRAYRVCTPRTIDHSAAGVNTSQRPGIRGGSSGYGDVDPSRSTRRRRTTSGLLVPKSPGTSTHFGREGKGNQLLSAPEEHY